MGVQLVSSETIGEPKVYIGKYNEVSPEDGAQYQQRMVDFNNGWFRVDMYMPESTQTYVVRYDNEEAWYWEEDLDGNLWYCVDIWDDVKDDAPKRLKMDSETNYFATGYNPKEVFGFKKGGEVWWYKSDDLTKPLYMSVDTGDLTPEGEPVYHFRYVQKLKEKKSLKEKKFKAHKGCVAGKRDAVTPEIVNRFLRW